MEEKYYYFRGNGSFITNGYAVFTNGKGSHSPNPYALREGNQKTSILTNTISRHGNSAFARLINYLESIQKREADKEQRFLQLKLEQLKQKLPEEQYRKIYQAIQKEDYNSAFFFIQKTEEDLRALKDEINKEEFKSLQKTSNFFNSQFSEYLVRELSKALEIKGDKLISTGYNVSIESLVDGFINEQLSGANGIIAYGLEEERENYIKQLTNLFQKKGILLKNWDTAAPLFTNRQRKDFTQLSGRRTLKKKNGKDLSLNTIFEHLGDGIQRGIVTELQAAAAAINTGSTAVLSGRFTREVGSVLEGSLGQRVSQKGDVVTFDIFSAEVDIDKIVQDVMKSNPLSGIEDIEKAIIEAIPDLEIFEVSQNIKGYKSSHDLKIEEEGNFNKRLYNIQKIAGNSYFDRLIFMLVNTTDECLLANRKEEVGLYIASAFSAYMWDDYEDFYNIKNHGGSITKLHLFNSGGVYFTASSLLKQTINELEQNFNEEGISLGHSSSLFDVTITPGSYSDSEYEQLVEDNPIKDGAESAVQSTLLRRWEAVKSEALLRGNISISLRQKELDKLLGNLEGMINEM